MLQLVFYGIRDVYEVCDRFSKEPISEETYVSEKLPPGTKAPCLTSGRAIVCGPLGGMVL